MPNPTPATPAQAATPGAGEQGTAPASAVTPTASSAESGKQSEAMVTIPVREYAELQRHKARVMSPRRANALPAASGDPNDPDAAGNAAIAEANRRALIAEIGLKVRDILDKPEYAALPIAARNIILKNPALLSKADNLEDALDDIEEFISGEAAAAKVMTSSGDQNAAQNGGQGGGDRAPQPAGHETPPVVASTTPAPTPAAGLEDTSNLSGPARSRAILRNSIRKSKGAKSE